MTMRSLLVLSAIGLLTGCGWVVGPEEGTRLGVISFYDDPVVISLPEVVAPGIPFEVTVLTYGGGCVSAGETEVEVLGSTVDITPRDVHTGHNVCTDILNIFEHSALVTLTDPGTAVIRFHGAQEPEGRRITIERPITVR